MFSLFSLQSDLAEFLYQQHCSFLQYRKAIAVFPLIGNYHKPFYLSHGVNSIHLSILLIHNKSTVITGP
jgi:hypothetical protein